MSEFRVSPDQVAAHAARLGGLASQVEEARGRIAAGAGAGAGTAAAGAVEGLAAHLSSTLPGFGAASERLRAALASASEGYSHADGVVRESAR